MKNNTNQYRWDGRIATSTFHEYINEAIFSIGAGLKIYDLNHLDEYPKKYLTNREAISDINYRYAFLMISSSLEAAANAMLLALRFTDDEYEIRERSTALEKINLFCTAKTFALDLGSHRIRGIKEMSACRNEFVHPKPKLTQFKQNDGTRELKFDVKKTSQRKYPHYFSEICLSHVLDALKDILDFLAWVVFDLCGYSNVEGALLIGYNSYGSLAVLEELEIEFNMIFDHRCFGTLSSKRG